MHPCCSVLFAVVRPGWLPGRHVLRGAPQLLRGQAELVGPVPMASPVAGITGSKDGLSCLAQALVLVLLQQNRGHRFIALQINLIPATNRDGWAAGHIVPTTAPRPC